MLSIQKRRKRALFLGPAHENLFKHIKVSTDLVSQEEKIEIQKVEEIMPDLIISYGYRHIIPKEVFEKYRTINMHISYLPYNRGADPNFWSFKDKTPKGVSIHEVVSKLDAGDIIYQKQVNFPPECDTLFLTYEFLKKEIEALLVSNWPDIIAGNYETKEQDHSKSTYHRRAELSSYWKQLSLGWNTNIEEISCLKEVTYK